MEWCQTGEAYSRRFGATKLNLSVWMSVCLILFSRIVILKHVATSIHVKCINHRVATTVQSNTFGRRVLNVWNADFVVLILLH